MQGSCLFFLKMELLELELVMVSRVAKRVHPSCSLFVAIGFTSCIVKPVGSRRSLISIPLWTPQVYCPTS